MNANLKRYVDKDGNIFSMNEKDAKERGYAEYKPKKAAADAKAQAPAENKAG